MPIKGFGLIVPGPVRLFGVEENDRSVFIAFVHARPDVEIARRRSRASAGSGSSFKESIRIGKPPLPMRKSAVARALGVTARTMYGWLARYRRVIRMPLGRPQIRNERPCLVHRAPPVTGWPWGVAEQCNPFGPLPLQNLHPYYELLRPCAPHRYSDPCGFSRLDASVYIGATGSHVPYKSLIRLRAAYMPDAAREVSQ
jgi:hypothetical protein